jgi:hypothetical protein
MIINSDLRMVIRSAEKAQVKPSWQEREKSKREAVASFVNSDLRRKAKINRALMKYAEASKAKNAARDEIHAYGLRTGDDDENPTLEICNEDYFVKAGGKIPADKLIWKFETVIAELASADQREGVKVLKKYGINWS